MRVVAVICEANPAHRGHARLCETVRARGADTILAVMSGSYVQRGECAIFDKYTRARAIVACGADIVVELPPPFCCAPARQFAAGGVALAAALGADEIAFGSEAVGAGERPDDLLARLTALAVFREKEEAERAQWANAFTKNLQISTQKNTQPRIAADGRRPPRDREAAPEEQSFTKNPQIVPPHPENRRQLAMERDTPLTSPDYNTFSEKYHEERAMPRAVREERDFERASGLPYPARAGDRLAAEYVRAARALPRAPVLVPLPRERDGLSAHASRRALREHDERELTRLIPSELLPYYRGAARSSWQSAFPVLLARLRTSTAEELTQLFDIPREVAVRMTSAARQASSGSFDEFFSLLKQKNDASARLRRALLTSLLGTKIDDFATPRVSVLLAANSRGRRALRELRAAIPLATSLGQAFSMGRKCSIAQERAAILRQCDFILRAELLAGFFRGEVLPEHAILRATPFLATDEGEV